MAAPGTAGADDEAALLARIRALSGAIEQHKSGGSHHGNENSASTSYSGGSSSNYSARGRPPSYSTRARGRGGSRGAYGRGYSQASGQYAGPHTSRHRSLVLSGPGGGDKQVPPSSTETESGSDQGSQSIHTALQDQEGWVKRKSTHNMSLVSSSTFQKTEPARVAAMAASQSAKQAAKAKAGTSHKPGKNSRNASLRRGDNMGEVIIDGVTFEFDETGTKLVKKQVDEGSESAAAGTSEPAGTQAGDNTNTPLKTSVNGQPFVRTKTGNMISQEILDRRKENKLNAAKLKRMEAMGKEIAARQKLRNSARAANKRAKIQARGLCAFFNKTGQCKNGLSCPFKHDPSRLAICPRSLRPNGCPLPAGTCPLSHERRPERVPHCVHYLATNGNCRNGDACIYTHPSPEVAPKVTNESPVCMEFSNFGWCVRGSACPMRHTWDCPDFLRKGKCERRGCKLMHIVRISNVEQERQESENRALRDDDLFLRDDDAAAAHEEDEEEGKDEVDVNSLHGKPKRKRALLEEAEDKGADEAGETTAFRPRKHQSQAFTGQTDFISFDDVEEGDSEDADDADATDEEEEEQDDNPLPADEDDDAEATSVHSVSSADEHESEEEV